METLEALRPMILKRLGLLEHGDSEPRIALTTESRTEGCCDMCSHTYTAEVLQVDGKTVLGPAYGEERLSMMEVLDWLADDVPKTYDEGHGTAFKFTWAEVMFGPIFDQLVNNIPRSITVTVPQTTWTEVTDPTTLKVGDHIKVTNEGEGFTLMGELDIPVRENGGLWDFSVTALADTACVSTDGSKFYIKETPFAPLNRALKPGEVVEDSMGRKYTTNPLNPALIITDTAGLTGPEEFVYMNVRPAR